MLCLDLDSLERWNRNSCAVRHEDAARKRVLGETRSPSWMILMEVMGKVEALSWRLSQYADLLK